MQVGAMSRPGVPSGMPYALYLDFTYALTEREWPARAIMAVIQIGCSQYGLQNWVQQMVTGAIIVLAVGLDRWRQTAAAERKRPA